MAYSELIVIGIGSCIIFDLWQRMFQIFTSIPPSNWAFVGRWFVGLISRGRIMASRLSEQPAVKHETLLGWIVHYSVAIGYAFVFAALIELEIFKPSMTDGLLFGIASVVVPWLFFMPAMGNGIFASKSANPPLACAMALMMHAIFGLSIGFGFSILA